MNILCKSNALKKIIHQKHAITYYQISVKSKKNEMEQGRLMDKC